VAADRRTNARSDPLVRLVGINHVALEVGDIERALEFYGRIFDLSLIEREPGMAFIEMGDQFIALVEVDPRSADRERHFGLVVDNRDAARIALAGAGIETLPGPRLDFRDPWGNRIQVVDYRDIQFTKTAAVLEGMGMRGLSKGPRAIDELRAKGLL
jgi:catechol 2,3-dioxygenase-like lactoylglutathione lyase family enzyme